jgi:hypothetical protein
MTRFTYGRLRLLVGACIAVAALAVAALAVAAPAIAKPPPKPGLVFTPCGLTPDAATTAASGGPAPAAGTRSAARVPPARGRRW